MMYFVKIKGLETIPLVTNEDGAREVIKSFDLPESALENGFSNEIISIVRSDNDSLDDAQKENLKLIYDQKFKEIMSFGEETKNLKNKIDERAFKEARRKYLESKIRYEKESQDLENLKKSIGQQEKDRNQKSIQELKNLIDDVKTPYETKIRAIGVLFADYGIRYKEEIKGEKFFKKSPKIENVFFEELMEEMEYEENKEREFFRELEGFGFEKETERNPYAPIYYNKYDGRIFHYGDMYGNGDGFK